MRTFLVLFAAWAITSASPAHAAPEAQPGPISDTEWKAVLGRLQAGFRDGDEGPLLRDLTQTAQRSPERLYRLHCWVFPTLDARAAAKPELDAEREAFEDALNSAGWSCDEHGATADLVWLNLIRRLVEHRNLDAASTVARKLIQPESVVELRSVKAYQPIVAAEPDRYRIDHVVAARLDQLRANVAAHPNTLENLNGLLGELLLANRAPEAADLARAALKRVQDNDGGPAPFEDMGQLNWTMDLLSRAEIDQGHMEESLKALQLGATLSEISYANVSQALNLAEFDVRVGRYQEALQLADSVTEHLSAYGEMDREGVRACAYAGLKQNDQLMASLAKMEQHRTISPAWLTEAYVCAGRLDRAAKVLEERIEDPRTRGSALADVQHYILPEQLPPAWRAMELKHQALNQDPGVKHAIELYGHVEDYPLVKLAF